MQFMHQKFTSSGVNFSAAFAAVDNKINGKLNPQNKTTKKSSKRFYPQDHKEHTRLEILVEVTRLLEELLEMRHAVKNTFH